MGSSDKKYPQFFKVFLSMQSSQILMLPSAFDKKIPGEIPSRVFLKDKKRSKHWLVDVAKINGRLYFQGGWSRFVIENSLTSGEFLVFKYSGHRIFEVIILGRHGCVKEFVELKENKEKELLDDEDDKDEDEDEEEEEEDDDEEMHYTISRNTSSKKNLSKHIANSDDEDGSDEDQSDDEDGDFIPTRKFRRL